MVSVEVPSSIGQREFGYEQMPGRFGGRDVARRVAGRPRAGA